jgi:CheY-like chemotaxis protein
MFLDDYVEKFQPEDADAAGLGTQVVPDEQPVEVKLPRNILVVDDDKTQTEVLAFRFRKLGYEVRVAHSGEDALKFVEQRRPDLILLDVQMPGIDGLEVCQQLSDDCDTCDIPVIILSGTERQDIIRRSRNVGCRYFVCKPYDPNALLVLAESALSDPTDW